MNQNLEVLIENHSRIMADQMVKAAEWAGSEEDVRHECNSLIDQFIRQAGLTVKGQHEYGLAGGRIDSKYGGVIIEYKDPKGAGKITENKNTSGVQAVVTQLKKRFRDFQKEERVSKELEAEIDEVAAKIWGLTNAELKTIQKALSEK